MGLVTLSETTSLSERPVLSFIEGFFAEFILLAPVPQAQVSLSKGSE
jgi:hypothetical protein